MTSKPAFKEWEHDGYAILHSWQQGCCAMCGFEGSLVMDHDHNTGLIRGYLCQSCNTIEGKGVSPGWDDWRNGDNPAALLGISEEYHYFSLGSKILEEMGREEVSEEDMRKIAEAVVSDEGEWYVELMIQQANDDVAAKIAMAVVQ